MQLVFEQKTILAGWISHLGRSYEAHVRHMRAIRGTAAPPLSRMHTSTSRAKKASLIGHAVRRPDGGLIKGLILPTPLRTWRRRSKTS